MRHLGTKWSAVVLDHNPSAVVGNQVQVIIDGTEVGTYSVSERIERGGMSGVRADLPDAEGRRVVQLMALGGNLKFVTEGSTYSVQLDGIAHALVYMSACDAEASALQKVQ